MSDAATLRLFSPGELEPWRAAQDERVGRWLDAVGFRGGAGQWCLLPDGAGETGTYLAGTGAPADMYALAALAARLPARSYRLHEDNSLRPGDLHALGFALAGYQFDRYKPRNRSIAEIQWPEAIDRAQLDRGSRAVAKVRDLVNTPTEDLGPAELAAEVRSLAANHAGSYREWVGGDLLAGNFPAIHAVGRASHRAPRLAELVAGNPGHPRVAIVGKGVCFDTGGLDIKSADGMRWMKKDMGGAAHAVALAQLILESGLPIQLQLLIPAVENALGPNSYRPGEVIRTRAGLSVEIDNTDAEGRVVLCDALAYAGESRPDLIVDFATLTGAARVALGPELPPLFCNRDTLAAELLAAAQRSQDPLWRMPLWSPYLLMLESRIADLANSGSSRMAGAITAALYLERFVPAGTDWAHIDCYAWNDSERPGRPRGGEAQGLRAVFEYLRSRFS